VHAKKKELEKIMEKLKGSAVLVEGRKDAEALLPFVGEGRVFAASAGRLRSACAKVAALGVREAFVLTDMDKAGDELALMARGELEGLGIRADLTTRKKLAGILHLRYFESFGKKHEKRAKELENA
jgi:5S rRNA maturation endonuclease (ribonuclease M5)